MKTWTLLLAGVVGVSLQGCADGGTGDNGRVRFSQVVNFVETDDFSPPLVVGRTVLIRLEHAPLGGQSFPELNLEVTGGAAQVLPLGFAQFAVRLDDAAAYRFRAREGTKEIDAITVTAARGASMRLHRQARLVTTGTDASGKRCARGSTVELTDLVLAPNQEAMVTVVPLDGSGAPMLGLLQLTAKASRDDVELDTPFFFQGGSPNTLVIRPTLASGPLGDASVEISEPAFAPLTQPIRVVSSEASVTCD
ncbi:MAG: hypothetical protein MUC96_18910 [Myxococcaceae bacterium]|jgi:hypothetical protein|nr:hypothetical protein [Myxococcaceae bacterium]